MQIETISATSLNTYQTCPYKWCLKYKYKLLEPDNDAFIVGKLFHKAAELYHTDYIWEDIRATIKKDILSGGAITQEKINNLGLANSMIDLYSQYPLGGKTEAVEYKFSYKLDGLDCTLIGYMDRIASFVEETNIYKNIIDYKTTNKDYTTKDANTIQAEIYAFAHEKIFNESAKVTFYVINKTKAKKPGYIPQIITVQPDTSLTLSKITDVYNGIKEDRFQPNKGNHCFWCTFKESCKYKNN